MKLILIWLSGDMEIIRQLQSGSSRKILQKSKHIHNKILLICILAFYFVVGISGQQNGSCLGDHLSEMQLFMDMMVRVIAYLMYSNKNFFSEFQDSHLLALMLKKAMK